MRYQVSVLFVAACAVPSVSQVDQDIVGGQPASTMTYPTVVDLETTPGMWFCTGTLVDKDWVLTAAHCVEGETAATLHIRFDDDNINDATGGKVVAVSEVHGDPGYNGQAWDNDIAVIKLAQSVTDRTVTPIHRDPVAFATNLTEVGYGDATNSGTGAGILRQVVKTTADCAGAHDASISNTNLICFDANDGKGSCYGDSGGPAFLDTGGGKLEVAGVTSGGSGNLCGAGWDLYTSVNAEIAWVDMYIPKTTTPPTQPPTDPTGDPMDPNNPPPGGGNDPNAEHGGCTSGGGGPVWLVALALVGLRRRRSRS